MRLLLDEVLTLLGLETDVRKGGSRKSKRRRVRHDIIIEILNVARDGKLKTHIMKEVELNFRQIQYYLKHLLSKNFIEKEGNLYRTTEKGLDIIEACKICLRLTEQ